MLTEIEIARNKQQTVSTSDLKLNYAVEQALRNTGQRVLRQLHVDVDNGTVTLTGSVNSFFLKQLAQTAVLKLDGMKRLDNKLDVIRSRP